MWNLDRAISPVGRRWKLRVLASNGLSLWWRWSYTIYSYDFNSNYWQFEENSRSCVDQDFFQRGPILTSRQRFKIAVAIIESKKEDNDHESIQSSTTPGPGYQWESNELTIRYHKQEPRGQPFPRRWPQGINQQTRSITNTRLQSQIPAFELTKASAKFEVATSYRLGGDAFTRKYISSLLVLTLGQGKTRNVAQYPLHHMTFVPVVWSCYVQQFRRKCLYKKYLIWPWPKAIFNISTLGIQPIFHFNLIHHFITSNIYRNQDFYWVCWSNMSSELNWRPFWTPSLILEPSESKQCYVLILCII